MDKSAYVRQPTVNGCLSLWIAPSPGYMLVDGAEFGKDHVLLMDAGSEADLVNKDEAAIAVLTVPKSYFEATARALLPRMAMNGEPIRIIAAPVSGWLALHSEMAGLLRNGSMSPEDLSHLSCRFLGLLAGEPGKRPDEVRLGDRANVARRAREYIAEHSSTTVRLEDLCRYTGVGARTLQRSFSRYFQVSVSNYIKAYRLNAARQALLARDPSYHSVTQIALDNGFGHVGRFSVDYRKHFGESPRETRAR
ncbi:MAG: helix-turn-helix domain-containing protein [Pseudomonadales bacterium]